MGVLHGAVSDPFDPGVARKRFHHGGEGQPPPLNGVAAVMIGPLLISLLPPEPLGEAAKSPQVSYAVALLLLAGILLSLLLRPPGR